jgi:hypothetical protein
MCHRKKFGFWIILMFGIVGLFSLGSSSLSVAAQEQAGSTPTPTTTPSSRFITVTYAEPINVRTGPSSLDYPIVGSIPVGGTAPAIGRSPAGEWIKITFPDAPGGTGWIYAPNVTLSPGPFLPIVEPPPTATPVETPTLNPTFAAAFQTVVSPTRLPTFTPPPPLAIPTYRNPASASFGWLQTGWVIIGLGLIGILGMAISSFRRR